MISFGWELILVLKVSGFGELGLKKIFIFGQAIQTKRPGRV